MALHARNTPFEAAGLSLGLDQKGFVNEVRISGSSNLIPSGAKAPLLSLRVNGKLEFPTLGKWNEEKKTLHLRYIDHQADIRITCKPTHVDLELIRVQPKKDVEVAVWGPIPTSLRESVGETIGVVQGKGVAFGLQVLNAKTLGGFPNTEDDVEPTYGFLDSSSAVDLSDRDAATDGYRGDTARPTDFGSVVQAYVRNRAQTRIIANWAHPFYTAPAFKDGGVVGSKIALFGCPAQEALDVIGKIELEEGLPHPMLDGVWAKVSPTARESYLVMGFNSKNLEDCLSITKRAGLRYLYTDGGFQTWGHFKLDPDGFPNNWQSMKECVDRAEAQGVRLGVHTLSNFITPNDLYVTPIPDKRLAEVGSSVLAADMTAAEGELTIKDPKFFNEMANNTLRTVRIGNELIQYDSVSANSPWRLIKCKRGAFGTRAASHKQGARIAKLMDHGYGTFLTNAELSQEVAENIGRLFTETGLMQVSMDGLEGNWSTGMGQYGRALFAKAWYDSLGPNVRGQVINDASNPGAYNWHINTRQNWGEPWYAGFRKSQTQYRLKNQHYFRRNLMPGMLGWFQMTSQTTLEDIEWLLARAAGFDAGFCITTSLEAVRSNPNGQEILGAVKAWESARRAHVFPSELLSKLQNINDEFGLVQISEGAWRLRQMDSQKFSWSGGVTEKSFNLPADRTNAKLIIQVPDKVLLLSPKIMIDGQSFNANWPSKCAGYRYLSLDLSGLHPGAHRLTLEAEVTNLKGTQLECELRVPLADPFVLRANTLTTH